jgi:hypothetical protein
MNNELEIMRKEPVVPSFGLVTEHLPGGTENFMKILTQDNGIQAEIWRKGPLSYITRVLITWPRTSLPCLKNLLYNHKTNATLRL